MLYRCTFIISVLTCAIVLAATANAQGVTYRKVDVFDPMPAYRTIAAGDFNGDGYPDVALSDSRDKELHVYLNDGSGGFSMTPHDTYSVGDDPRDIAIAEFTGDSHLDIAVVNRNDWDISLFQGKGDGSFDDLDEADTTSQAEPTALAAFDANNDTYIDLVTANSRSASISLWLGNGDGSFQSPVSYSSVGTPTDVAALDIDSDNDMDLIVGNGGSDWFAVHTNDGTGDFSQSEQIVTSAAGHRFAVGDLNNDTYTDIAVVHANHTENTAEVWLGDGAGGFTQGQVWDPADYPQGIALADVEGDGDLDMFVADNNGFYIYENDGSAGFTEYYTQSVSFNSLWKIAAVDLDRDGYADVATQEYAVFLSSDPTSVEPAGPAVNTFGIRSVYPNPARTDASIQIAAESGGNVRLELVNTIGQVVSHMTERYIAPGMHTVRMDFSDVRPGVYMLRYSSPAGIHYRRISVLR